MRSSDLVLVAALLSALALLLALQIREGRANGVWLYRMVVDGAADGESHPVVARIDDPASAAGLEPGDTLLQVGDFDLRGVTSRGTIARANRAASGGSRAVVVAERRGRRFETRIERLPQPLWWSGIPFALAMVAVATLVLLKAPHRQGTRELFVAAGAAGLTFATGFGRIFPETQIVAGLFVASSVVMWGAATAFALRFRDFALPLGPWQRSLPYLAAGVSLFGMVAYRWLPPLVPGLSNITFHYLGFAFAVLLVLVGWIVSYRQADALERRQYRWVLYGVVVGLSPQFVISLVQASVTTPPWLEQIWALSPLAIPLGFGIAIFGYRLFDIDRLISATTSVAILGLAVLGAVLAVVPQLAAGLSHALGLDAALGQWALSLAAVGLLLPVHRSLRPWLDRRMFAEQAERMAGFEQLLAELSACGSAGELTTLSGERVDVLLEPESIATYARQGDLFTPIFVRGHAAPAAFAADSVLVRALETRTTPLATDDEALDAFDRAALTTLGAELVIPARRTAILAAFTCLGRKRSGDIYTATDRAVLSAVAHKIGERLTQLDAEDLARDTQAMQERLRRYVPGAVADELAAGRELEPEEREVSVLFVDLRGYTSFAESRAAHDVFSTINEHTERVSRIVKARGGTVVEFNGDGMMAVFGAPEALANKERAAVLAGREIVEGMPATLGVGVGIATGEAVVGSIRSADRWIWSAIGNTTNLAARLQVLTRELDAAIAVDEATQRAASYACAGFARHQGIRIRGRTGRWDVYALPAEAPDRGADPGA